MYQIQYNSKTRFHDTDRHQHNTVVRCQVLPCCASISVSKTTTQEVKVIGNGAIRYATNLYHFLLLVCSYKDSTLHGFRDPASFGS